MKLSSRLLLSVVDAGMKLAFLTGLRDGLEYSAQVWGASELFGIHTHTQTLSLSLFLLLVCVGSRGCGLSLSLFLSLFFLQVQGAHHGPRPIGPPIVTWAFGGSSEQFYRALSLSLCLSLSMYVRTYVCIYECMCIYIYIYIYIYIT